jgi:hypothetical protein
MENMEKLPSNNEQKLEQPEQENLSLKEKRKEKIRGILAASPLFQEFSEEEIENLIQTILGYFKGKEDILDMEDVSESETEEQSKK